MIYRRQIECSVSKKIILIFRQCLLANISASNVQGLSLIIISLFQCCLMRNLHIDASLILYKDINE